MKIKAAFNEMRHHSTQLVQYGLHHYFYHNVDEYWDFEIGGDVYRACFSTGLTYQNNNLRLPENEFTFNEENSDPIFKYIDEACEDDFLDDELIQEMLEGLRQEGLELNADQFREVVKEYNEIYPAFDEQEISELEIKQKLAMENMHEHLWVNPRY